jgi:multicomponent Na+:H+ antiporter subunit D
MARIWDAAFWKPAATEATRGRLDRALLAPAAVLVALMLALSAAAGPVFDLTTRAAEELLAPGAYVRAVLGGA